MDCVYCTSDDVIDVLPDTLDSDVLGLDKIQKAINHAGSWIDARLKHLYKTPLQVITGDFPTELTYACAYFSAHFCLLKYFSGNSYTQEQANFRKEFKNIAEEYLTALEAGKYFVSEFSTPDVEDTSSKNFYFDEDEEYTNTNEIISRVTSKRFL